MPIQETLGQFADYQFETADLLVFATLILLEGVLSFDNAAVLAAMARRLPKEQQKKALLYGLVGAYIFRFTAILFATYLIEYPWLRFIGGLYLLYLMVSHFVKHAGDHKLAEVKGILGLSPFWSTVLMIEIADIVFALDQIVAAVALTQKVPVIIAAAFIAILALRLSATYMIRLMNWFPQMEHLAYLAVGWVGLKLFVEDGLLLMHLHAASAAQSLRLPEELHVPKAISIGVTLGILAGPILFKIVMDIVRRRRGEERPPQQPDVHPPVP